MNKSTEAAKVVAMAAGVFIGVIILSLLGLAFGGFVIGASLGVILSFFTAVDYGVFDLFWVGASSLLIFIVLGASFKTVVKN